MGFCFGRELTELEEQKGGFEAGKGGALPEGREGLFHQVFQAFQLRPAGREMASASSGDVSA